MFKIELRKNPRSRTESPNLVVNGKVDKQSFVFDGKDGRIFACLYSSVVAEPLMDARLSEIEAKFEHIELPYEVEWSSYIDSVSVDFRIYREKKFPSVDVELQPDGEKWAKPYSMAEYAEALERVIKGRNTPNTEFFQSDELISNGFGIRSRITSSEATVRNEIERCVQELKRVCCAAENQLLASTRRNSVTTFFSFSTRN